MKRSTLALVFLFMILLWPLGLLFSLIMYGPLRENTEYIKANER